MKRLALAGVALLSACAGFPAGPAPETAVLASGGTAGDQLEVKFSDGSNCRALVPPTGGQGVFEGCPQARGYEVTIHHRNLLEPIFGAAVTPYARVAVTAASGRVTTFILPTGGGR